MWNSTKVVTIFLGYSSALNTQLCAESAFERIKAGIVGTICIRKWQKNFPSPTDFMVKVSSQRFFVIIRTMYLACKKILGNSISWMNFFSSQLAISWIGCIGLDIVTNQKSCSTLNKVGFWKYSILQFEIISVEVSYRKHFSDYCCVECKVCNYDIKC